jgi:hypothetical protein
MGGKQNFYGCVAVELDLAEFAHLVNDVAIELSEMPEVTHLILRMAVN